MSGNPISIPLTAGVPQPDLWWWSPFSSAYGSCWRALKGWNGPVYWHEGVKWSWDHSLCVCALSNRWSRLDISFFLQVYMSISWKNCFSFFAIACELLRCICTHIRTDEHTWPTNGESVSVGWLPLLTTANLNFNLHAVKTTGLRLDARNLSALCRRSCSAFLV